MNHITASAVTIALGVSAYIVHSIVPNWVADALERIGRKLLIHSRHSYIVYTHSKQHQLPTPEHTGKLKVCQDHPCDLLHKPPDDLGLR